MKLTFFLIGLFLVLLRIYYPYTGFWHNGNNTGTMTIKSDDFIEEVRWSGNARLSGDERSIAEITPGGYVKFREDDQTLEAESNLQGEISYTLYDGRENLSLNDSGRRFIANVLQKMIGLGFYSDGRAERIYKKGGNSALLAELSRIKMTGAKDPYLDLLFRSDSLTDDERLATLQQIDSFNEDDKKEHYLNLFPAKQLTDSGFGLHWLAAVGHMGREDLKKELLVRYIQQDTLAGGNKTEVTGRFDSVLAIAGRFNEDEEKKNLYRQLIDRSGTTDEEWISLIGATGALREDDMKAELLTRIALQMPKQDKVKAGYLAAARTIKDDTEYGKVMRAIN